MSSADALDHFDQTASQIEIRLSVCHAGDQPLQPWPPAKPLQQVLRRAAQIVAHAINNSWSMETARAMATLTTLFATTMEQHHIHSDAMGARPTELVHRAIADLAVSHASDRWTDVLTVSGPAPTKREVEDALRHARDSIKNVNAAKEMIQRLIRLVSTVLAPACLSSPVQDVMPPRTVHIIPSAPEVFRGLTLFDGHEPMNWVQHSALGMLSRKTLSVHDFVHRLVIGAILTMRQVDDASRALFHSKFDHDVLTRDKF